MSKKGKRKTTVKVPASAKGASKRKPPQKKVSPSPSKEKVKKKPKEIVAEPLSFTKANYIVFVLALILIVVGWILLAKGSMTLAPLILVISYCVLIPISILIGIGKGKSVEERMAESGARLD